LMNFDTFRDFHPIFNLPTHMDMWNRVFLKPFYAFLFVAGDRVDRGLLVPLRTYFKMWERERKIRAP